MNQYVRLIKLPLSIKGMTVEDENGDYNIFINKNLSMETQIQTYIHETQHIENNDFESNANIKNIEYRVREPIYGKKSGWKEKEP